jgi:hypothetical protein
MMLICRESLICSRGVSDDAAKSLERRGDQETCHMYAQEQGVRIRRDWFAQRYHWQSAAIKAFSILFLLVNSINPFKKQDCFNQIYSASLPFCSSTRNAVSRLRTFQSALRHTSSSPTHWWFSGQIPVRSLQRLILCASQDSRRIWRMPGGGLV